MRKMWYLSIILIIYTQNIYAINIGVGGQSISDSKKINNVQEYDATSASVLLTLGNESFKLKLSEDIKAITVKIPFGKLSFETSSIDIYPFIRYEKINVEKSDTNKFSFNYLGFGIENEDIETSLNSDFKKLNINKSGLHLSELFNYLFDIVIENTDNVKMKKGIYPFADYYAISGDVTSNQNEIIPVKGSGYGLGLYAWWIVDVWSDKELYVDLIYAKYNDEFNGNNNDYQTENTFIRIDLKVNF